MANQTINGLTAETVASLSDLLATWNLSDAGSDKATKQQLLTLFLNISNTWISQQQFNALTIMNGLAQLAIGASGTAGKLGGVQLGDLFADVPCGTTGVETILYSVTIPASGLGTNGDKIQSWLSGVTVAHATATRQIRVYFGPLNSASDTKIYDSTAQATPTTANNWDLHMRAIRVSSTVVRTNVTMVDSQNLTTWPESQYTSVTPTGTTTVALFFTVTGTCAATGAAAADIVAKMGSAEWKSAN